MAQVLKLTFNPFQENTYVVFDESGECVIFDPGCYTTEEKQLLVKEIERKGLRPVRLINTHCHIDHVFGNQFVADHYGLGLEIHSGELPVLKAAPQSALFFGLSSTGPLSPEPEKFIEEGDTVEFGQTKLKAILTPGHSPASLSFFCEDSRFVIAGDVLFYGSIGRTDLPGGDFRTLINSIVQKLFPLGDDVVVYSGHGPDTNIGYERMHNPFLTGR
ncbi:MAG: MBL fold metallo-hydrolase [Lewinellaceae bacterium]|nr:MBL fold metallo-hydrolase [Lewinellaceae bacterium]